MKEHQITNLPISLIKSNPYQPRKSFNQLSLDELANSIQEHGVIEPISVRQVGAVYELVSGERRVKAARLVGLEEIPARIINLSIKESAIVSLTQSTHRDNLNFFEIANAYQAMIDDYGYTKSELALTLSVSQSVINNRLKLLKLPYTVKRKLIEYQLEEQYATALLKLKVEKNQLQVLTKIFREQLGINKTEEIIEKIINEDIEEIDEFVLKRPKVRTLIKDMRVFTNSITQAVDLLKKSGIDVDYTVDEQAGEHKIIIKNKGEKS